MPSAAAPTAVRTAVTALLLLLGAAAPAAAFAAGATSSCAATVTITGPNKGHLVLAPAAPKVAVGDCLAFTNSTSGAVDLAITKAGATVYSAHLAKAATTPTAHSYTPKTAGKASLTASAHVLLLKFTGAATVTVEPAPKRTPTSSASPGSGGHQHHPPRHHPAKHQAKGHHKAGHRHSPKPHATGFKLPPLPPLPTVGASALPKGSSPVVAPGLASSAPTVTAGSSTPVAAVVAGPLETAQDTGRGLPIAAAVLVVLGLASGYGRVLLAAPRSVDSRRRGDHRA